MATSARQAMAIFVLLLAAVVVAAGLLWYQRRQRRKKKTTPEETSGGEEAAADVYVLPVWSDAPAAQGPPTPTVASLYGDFSGLAKKIGPFQFVAWDDTDSLQVYSGHMQNKVVPLTPAMRRLVGLSFAPGSRDSETGMIPLDLLDAGGQNVGRVSIYRMSDGIFEGTVDPVREAQSDWMGVSFDANLSMSVSIKDGTWNGLPFGPRTHQERIEVEGQWMPLAMDGSTTPGVRGMLAVVAKMPAPPPPPPPGVAVATVMPPPPKPVPLSLGGGPFVVCVRWRAAAGGPPDAPLVLATVPDDRGGLLLRCTVEPGGHVALTLLERVRVTLDRTKETAVVRDGPPVTHALAWQWTAPDQIRLTVIDPVGVVFAGGVRLTTADAERLRTAVCSGVVVGGVVAPQPYPGFEAVNVNEWAQASLDRDARVVVQQMRFVLGNVTDVARLRAMHERLRSMAT